MREKAGNIDSDQAFFFIFWFHWPIRQIKNIFIPLLFHWSSLNINPDWNYGGSTQVMELSAISFDLDDRMEIVAFPVKAA